MDAAALPLGLPAAAAERGRVFVTSLLFRDPRQVSGSLTRGGYAVTRKTAVSPPVFTFTV
jgi:hypothetical protein